MGDSLSVLVGDFSASGYSIQYDIGQLETVERKRTYKFQCFSQFSFLSLSLRNL